MKSLITLPEYCFYFFLFLFPEYSSIRVILRSIRRNNQRVVNSTVYWYLPYKIKIVYFQDGGKSLTSFVNSTRSEEVRDTSFCLNISREDSTLYAVEMRTNITSSSSNESARSCCSFLFKSSVIPRHKSGHRSKFPNKINSFLVTSVTYLVNNSIDVLRWVQVIFDSNR